MELSQDAIDELKEIYEEDFDLSMTDDQAKAGDNFSSFTRCFYLFKKIYIC